MGIVVAGTLLLQVEEDIQIDTIITDINIIKEDIEEVEVDFSVQKVSLVVKQ